MKMQRRTFLRAAPAGALAALAGGAGLLRPAPLLAADWNKGMFEAKGLDSALKAIGATGAIASRDIVIKAPDAAENGAVVPVEVTSGIPNTEAIVVIAEKNTTPLVAEFTFANGGEPYVATRIKLVQTTAVRALARAGGKVYTAGKEIKVTIGGCGG